jgi:hypothetical protein
MITPGQFLNITKDVKTNKSFRLAIIENGYTEGKPRVIFDGETKPTAKRYPYLESYIPTSGDRILMVYVGGSYVILGKIN